MKQRLLFEKTNKIDNPLANLHKMKRKKRKSAKSETQKRDNNKHHGIPWNYQRLL
jgi:hypothetical protein